MATRQEWMDKKINRELIGRGDGEGILRVGEVMLIVRVSRVGH